MVDCDRAGHHVLHRAALGPCDRVPEDGGLLRLLAIIAALACCHIGIAATTKLEPQTIAYWQAMHRCEQADAWSHQQFPEYKGGLGISNGAWTWWAGELGLLKRYRNAGYAPPLVQIRVADYGWRHYRGLWGCMRTIGYPP